MGRRAEPSPAIIRLWKPRSWRQLRAYLVQQVSITVCPIALQPSLSMVRIGFQRPRIFRHPNFGLSSICWGRRDLLIWDVIAAAITVGLCLFPGLLHDEHRRIPPAHCPQQDSGRRSRCLSFYSAYHKLHSPTYIISSVTLFWCFKYVNGILKSLQANKYTNDKLRIARFHNVPS